MNKQQQLNKRRIRRVYRVSNHVKRYSSRPRLCVFRSNKHICAQIIDDAAGKTLVSAATTDKAIRGVSGTGSTGGNCVSGGNCAAAVSVGTALAQKAVAAGITSVAFDRHGYRYHGRVKALADAARKAGLDIGAFTEEPVVKESAKKDVAKKDGGKKDTTKSSGVKKPADKKSGDSKKK